MGVPRHHMAKGKQLRRRSHLALKPALLASCANCKQMIRPHRICRYCGSYKGRTVVDIVGRTLKKQERKKKRAQGQT